MLSWVFRINGNVVINLSTPTGRDTSSKQQIQLTECLLDRHTKGMELSWPSSLEAASLKITWCSWFLRIPGLRSADLISKGAGNVLAEPRTIKQGLPRVINYSLFNAQDWQRCQLFNLIREILCKRCILVKFCSLSFTSGFILSISQTNTLNLFSQKSSHVDKTNYFMLHTYIYLERCLQILLWLAGTPIVFLSFLKEKLPKAEELKDINPHPQPLHLPPQFPKFCHYISLTEWNHLRKSCSKQGQRIPSGRRNK